MRRFERVFRPVQCWGYRFRRHDEWYFRAEYWICELGLWVNVSECDILRIAIYISVNSEFGPNGDRSGRTNIPKFRDLGTAHRVYASRKTHNGILYFVP